jgi:hypothetical protein
MFDGVEFVEFVNAKAARPEVGRLCFLKQASDD